MSIVGLALFGLLWFGPPLLLWVLAARDIAKARRMSRWPRVDGTVLDVRTRPGTRGVIKFDVQMRFEFEGRTVKTWCISPTRAGSRVQDGGDEKAFRNQVERWKKGASHPVIVNPDNPDEAYVRMPEWHIITALIVCSLIWIIVIGANLLLE